MANVNEGKKCFTLSWDLKKDSVINNDQFRTLLVDLLLDQDCILKSYTESCICFTCDDDVTFSFWYDLLEILFEEYVWSNFSEIVKDKDGKFNLFKQSDPEHEKAFDDFVKDRIKNKDK